MKAKIFVPTFFWMIAYITGQASTIRSFITDRDLYVSGDRIQFSASIQNEAESVLYVELINADGKNYSKNKFTIHNFSAAGCLEVPPGIVTGIYFLMSYTKAMRNAGTSSYTFKPVKIINPFSAAVYYSPDTLASVSPAASMQNKTFTIQLNQKSYLPGSLIGGEIHLIGNENQNDHVSIAVVPAGTNNNTNYLNQSASSTSRSNYLPESHGLSISGVVREIASGNIVEGARVNLSIIGGGRDFMAVKSDSLGRFFISLPAYSGYRDVFLGTEKDSTQSLQLFIDNDFNAEPVRLNSVAFHLTASERQAALRLAQNIQIEKYYVPDTTACERGFETSHESFYGVPNEVIHFDQYVELPTLEEYFNELPTAVKVRKHDGRQYFKVIGTHAELNYYNPLVLVDWVAVSDPHKILAAPPSTIDRIEVVNVPYVKGDITYGGIVSIVSKAGDFGGIDLPKSGVFLHYQFLNDNCKCKSNTPVADAKPDTRNTIYWEPDLQFKNGVTVVSFIAPLREGEYIVVINGVETGRIEVQKNE